MPKEQRTFSKEFKLEAVRLAQASGKSTTQVACDLGIADWITSCRKRSRNVYETLHVLHYD